MNIRSLILASVAVVAIAGPAAALTWDQAIDEMGGYKDCSGNSCSKDVQSITVVDNPDIITSFDELVSPATFEDPKQPDQTSPAADYKKGGWWNERCQTIAYVNADCTVQSIAPLGGGTPAVYRTVTIVTDGGTTEVPVCTTTVKTMSYNPQGSRETSWSIETSSSSREGSC